MLMFIIFILVSSCFFGWADESIQNKYFVLENGLKVLLEERAKIPLVSIGFAINVGSKDEAKETSGLVHLLEHLLLFGSTGSSSHAELTRQIRRNGLHFNAHTSHDLMTFEISVPTAQAPFAFELLSQKLFNLKLVPAEVEKEKKVILEELSQEADDPGRLGIQLSLRALFSGHPYENPVGGEKTTIKNAAVEALERFYKKYFIPANGSLAVVGNFNIETVEEKIKQTFGKIKNPGMSDTDNKARPEFKPVSPLEKNVRIRRELDITQAHFFLGFIAPGLNHEDKLAMDVLTQILGRGVNPLLYRSFTGRRRLVENLEIHYIPLKDGGAVLIHLVLDPKKLSPARSKLLSFLKQTRSFKYSKKDHRYSDRPFVTDYLETAKAWLRLTFQQYIERQLNLAVSYARFLLTRDNPFPDQQEGPLQKSYSERMEAVKSSDLQKAAANFLAGKKYAAVAIVPKKK
jgi:predicted Zn-dependent peptidase